MNEYSVTIRDKADRLEIAIIRTNKDLNKLIVNYDQAEIDVLWMRCVRADGKEIPVESDRLAGITNKPA